MGYTKNIMCCVVQNAFFELVCFMAFLLNKEILTKIIYDIGNTWYCVILNKVKFIVLCSLFYSNLFAYSYRILVIQGSWFKNILNNMI